ncbi:unnamed protein product [Cuscuta europaea]|uniref:Transcription factor IIIC 90kDa subunit N-terminal domain-containing protein n=3 Tax=Cuscuta europaea TaxID=41803 RepID=A0A9P0YX86_CUSEU|nr:unnamed protein product [Cuscuta europaea]
MSLGFQVAALVGAPSCPNAIAWSEDNLVAVASGHLVTILNPAKPFVARGLVTVPASKPFQIGLVDKKDLTSGCLLPICISRDIRPCVRSISWSPIGFASNASCFLAICTTEGRVKVYRMPFCEFRVEWIEVVDISEMLYTYLENANFEDASISSNLSYTTDACDNPEFEEDMTLSHFLKTNKQRKLKALTVVNVKDGVVKKKTRRLSAEEYASRNAMISSLTVAWSPHLRWKSGFSVLAVGGKSGRLSFWRFHQPQCYSTRSSSESSHASFLGFLQAHNTWITSITWALIDSDASNHQVMLFTGSCNGSVKIWQACNKELQESSDISPVSFSLLKEVTSVDCGPVSVLSVIVPLDSPSKISLAIGKGSGTVDVWICEMCSSTFKKVGSYRGHDHIVTGLAWAFNGHCLYSCSQDNTLCSWILMENYLHQVSIPSNTLGMMSSADMPTAFDSCCGLAVSPGNLVLAVVHGYDTELLNPMYEARSCKAAIEFLWIGGQHLDPISDILPDSSEREMTCLETNILWSLQQFNHNPLDKPLIMWDIVAALLAFNQSNPKCLENILLKWLASVLGGPECDISTDLSQAFSRYLPRLASRTLQLFNVITRQVVLKMDDDKDLGGVELWDMWKKVHIDVERELRDRLVGFSLSVISSNIVSGCDEEDNVCRIGGWVPIGLAQMERWVDFNKADMKENLMHLAENVGRTKKRRLNSIYTMQEECSFCSASVPLGSPEFAFCQGEKTNESETRGPSHKLPRCSVSMLVCPPTTPPWHCVCCKRWASQLAPSTLFTLPEYPSDFEPFIQQQRSSTHPTKPWCPFCGILLQRLQPEFLLSPTPV